MKLIQILVISSLVSLNIGCSDGYRRSYSYSKIKPSTNDRIVKIQLTTLILGLIPERKIKLQEEACGDGEIISVSYTQPNYLFILFLFTLYMIETKTLEVRCSG